MERVNVLDFLTGKLELTTSVQERYLSDLVDYFAFREEAERILKERNPLIYKVYEMAYSGPGALSYAITEIEPGKIGKEYYFTKGHFHSKAAAEVYIVLGGKGILLMENRSGNTRTLNMFKGAVLYVDPEYAHRSINTGNEKLIFLAVYQSDAGHDYESIKEKGFSFIVVDENGPKIIKNPRSTKK